VLLDVHERTVQICILQVASWNKIQLMTACVCSGRQNLQKKGMQKFGNSQGLIIITIIVWQANLQKKSDLIIYIIRILQKKKILWHNIQFQPDRQRCKCKNSN